MSSNQLTRSYNYGYIVAYKEKENANHATFFMRLLKLYAVNEGSFN